MRNFVISYQKNGETYGDNVLAQSYYDAEQIAKDRFGESAKVDGTLVMSFDCNENDKYKIQNIVQNHCVVMNTKKL